MSPSCHRASRPVKHDRSKRWTVRAPVHTFGCHGTSRLRVAVRSQRSQYRGAGQLRACPVTRPHLARLFVYPVKSAAGIELQHAHVDDFGIEHDRRFLIVDQGNTFMTQREYPGMSQIRVRIEPPHLVLSAPDGSLCTVPLRPDAGARIHVRIWEDTVEAVRVADTEDWLSRAVGARCSLVYMPDDVVRHLPLEYSVRPDTDRVGFADAFPFLIVSQASIDELNARLERALDVRRFRPNLLIDGVAPHAEDTWSLVRIGTLDLHVVKPCARCAITTVDPDTGARGREPLRTLAEYRTSGGKVYFAQNAVHVRPGELHVGDVLEVLEPGAHQSLSGLPGLKS